MNRRPDAGRDTRSANHRASPAHGLHQGCAPYPDNGFPNSARRASEYHKQRPTACYLNRIDCLLVTGENRTQSWKRRGSNCWIYLESINRPILHCQAGNTLHAPATYEPGFHKDLWMPDE